MYSCFGSTSRRVRQHKLPVDRFPQLPGMTVFQMSVIARETLLNLLKCLFIFPILFLKRFQSALEASLVACPKPSLLTFAALLSLLPGERSHQRKADAGTTLHPCPLIPILSIFHAPVIAFYPCTKEVLDIVNPGCNLFVLLRQERSLLPCDK